MSFLFYGKKVIYIKESDYKKNKLNRIKLPSNIIKKQSDIIKVILKKNVYFLIKKRGYIIQ